MAGPRLSDYEKIEYVVDALAPMLKNDIRVVAESGCKEHGCGSGPQFTLALLCMVACETIGLLAAPVDMPPAEATREFLNSVGAIARNERYRKLSGLLVAFFRNGIAHSFLPKQTQALDGYAVWNGECFDQMSAPGGNLQLDLLRSRHLTIRNHPDGRRLEVITKVLCVDITRGIDAFVAHLKSLDNSSAKAQFYAAFDRWLEANSGVRGKLTMDEKLVLDSAVEVF
jgi:hypothetical protein